MNYEEKYKQALDRARKELQECVHKDCDDMTRRTAITIIQNLFPELKESEDEIVKNEIIAFVEQSIHRGGGTPIPQEQENKWLAWLEKQGEKSTIIDVDKMVMEYSQTKDGDFGLPVNCMIRAYSKGINDALKLLKQGEKTLNADEVIAWLDDNICEAYDYDGEGIPLISKFKEDFGLC